jgi:hypothetical protein
MSHEALSPVQFRQGRLFNPDNPPLAFSKEEGEAGLAPIRAEVRRHQVSRMQRHNVEKHRESSRP